jgi:hypothetical protein
MYKLISEKIKDKLVSMYIKRFGGDIEFTNKRRLLKFKHVDSYGNVGSIMYSLEGSPPKGYALYIPDMHKILFLHADFTKSLIVDIDDYIKEGK